MMTNAAPSTKGAFVQLIEYRTDHGEEVAAIIGRWADAIGAQRTARWYVTGADRDRAREFVQLVEFPSYEAAQANSDHPATSVFAAELQGICDDQVVFRNLDVMDGASYADPSGRAG